MAEDPTAASGVFAPNPHPLMGADTLPSEPLPPNAPGAVAPLPDNYLERVVGLSKVHPWMPQQTVATIAGLPASDQAIAQMATDLRKTYASVDNAIKYTTDDPLLQKTPSLGLYIRSYLTNTIGPWPLADEDLNQIQQGLQKQGFGKGLPANGQWDTQWNSAFTLWSSNLRAQALGGSQPGSMPVGQALRGLNQLLPVESSTSLGAFITSIPQSVQQDLHTFAGTIAGGADALYQGFQPKNLLNPNFTPNRKTEAGVESKAENAVTFTGPQTTPQTAFSSQSGRTQAMDVLQVAGDLLSTHGVFRAGSAVSDAARATHWGSLDATAATRGPGTVASKFFGPTVAGEAKPLLGRALPDSLLTPESTVNQPILRMAGPVADKIAGGDGYYYRARTLLASPYAVPGAKVAGTAVGQFGLAGAKIRGAASLESVVGGQQSNITQAINHFQSVNQFNAAVQNRLAFNAFGHHFTPGLNTLAWVMYPPFDSAGTVSHAIGSDLTGFNDSVQEALGPRTGFGISIDRGVNWTKHGDQNVDYAEMVKMAGGPQHFSQFWGNKIFEHAAAHYAEREFRDMPDYEQSALTDPGQFQDRNAALADMANGALQRAKSGDPSDLLQAAHEMISDDNPMYGQWGGHNGLSKRIAAEIDRSGMSPKAWLQKYMVNYGDASRDMRQMVIPRRSELVSDEVPGSDIGMATADYLTRDQAVADVQDLEKQYTDAAQKAKPDPETGVPAPADAWKNFEDAASALRAYLKDKFGIDGPRMPQDDDQLIELLKQKAEAQNPRLFPRNNAMRIEPEDTKPRLHLTAPETGKHSLERSTPGPVFANVSPTDALDIIHEERSPSLHPWVNSRDHIIGNQTVTIEHDPKTLTGMRDRSAGSGYEDARGIGHFDASREHTHGFDDIRSVSIRSQNVPLSYAAEGADKQRTATQLLKDQLEAKGYVPFDKGNGLVRYVRPDLVGGTIATSPELQTALDHMEQLGFIPVQGKGIGFGFYNHPIFDVADSHLTTAKRFVERLGLSPENIPSPDIGFTWNMLFNDELLKSVEKGDVKLYPTHTTQTIISMMRDRDAIPSGGGISSVVQHLPGPPERAYQAELQARTLELMRKTGKGQKDAQNIIATRMSQELENPLGLVHLTKKDLRAALNRTPDTMANGRETQVEREAEHQGVTTGPDGQPMYSEKAIDAIYRAIQKANARMPARMVGWQKAENLTAYGLSYMGRQLPGSIGRGLEYLPTRLVTLRNKARFTLSPEFALRRVVKVNAKIMLDDVAPTFHPMRALMAGGKSEYDKAMARLDRIMPEMKNPEYDEGTQALYANDPWGIYNHRNYEAYAAREWAKQGKTDTEIRQLIIKDFGYGSKAYGEGRSALERSTNFVFFPFSFDKTLYRNSGAYLLDHTAQRLILQAGLEAYQRYNNSDPNGNRLMSSNWWLNHAPLINEALRLNAFAHGLGLGQFGGINAPLLNLFIPQSYASSSAGVSLLRGILPIMRQFQDLYSESTQTFKITQQLTEDQFIHNPTLKGFKGKGQTEAEAAQAIFFAKPVAETATAQLDQAYTYRRQLAALFKNEVDYNAHHTNKITLGSNESEFGQYAGRVINATLVDYLTNQKYPAFQPDNPSIYYAQEAQAINSFTYRMQNEGQTEVVKWLDVAQKAGTAMYNHTHGMDTASAVAATKVLRAYAVFFAETIPGFLTFYNTNFRWELGPLEAVR